MRKLRFKSKNLTPFIIIGLIIIGVVIALVLGEDKPKPPAKVASTGCGTYHKDGVITLNGQPINVEIAYDSRAKTKGLSGRPCIQPNWGMLFDFGQNGRYAIWMKDMKFPIDVIWISAAHNIVAIERNFKPSSYPDKRINQNPARYVLEIKAGQSKVLKLGLDQPVHFQKT